MKIYRQLLTILVIILAVAACQPQMPVVDAPAPMAPEAPVETAETVIEPTEVITAENIDRLEETSSLYFSGSAMLCGWSTDSQTIAITDMAWAGLYSAETFELNSQFTGDESTYLYAVSPNSGLAAYSLDGATIQLYDFAAKADRLSIEPNYQLANAFFSPDGSQLAVESADAIEVFVYDTESGEKTNTLSGYETAAPVYSASFSPNGAYLLWLSRATTQPMEISSQSFFPELSHEDFISAVKMSHDTFKVATAAAGTLGGEFQALITLWGTQTGEFAWQAGNAEYFTALDFSADDTLLAAGTKNEIIFLDTSTGSVISRLQIGGDRINGLDFSPDGRSLLTCTSDGAVTIWTIKD